MNEPNTGTVWQLFDLTDRVFLVAGGARDLGRDMAVALAEAHAHGAITSRSTGSAETAAADIADSTGADVIGLPLEATSEDQVRNVVDRTVQRFGRIDILVNCVGGGASRGKDEPRNLEDRELEDWRRLQDANMTAPFLLCKHVAPVMRRQQSGAIINIASISGMVGRDRRVYLDDMAPQPVDYSAAKGGVLGFTRDLAAYLGPAGIRVNAISPGGFERGQPPAFIDAYSRKCILGRMGKDGVDLKGAVLYLASDAAAYVTGHNLVVDGGFTVWQ